MDSLGHESRDIKGRDERIPSFEDTDNGGHDKSNPAACNAEGCLVGHVGLRYSLGADYGASLSLTHSIDALCFESVDKADVAVSNTDPGQTSEQRDKIDLRTLAISRRS